ncbi:ABC-2 type transport system permease protein [Pseudobutyrivibrio sp. C4]|uniref:ABC transporter permease n=1 Tax=unclassified Pseudobutyrivibrio TaxID=2638619 RepID=UPI0008947AB7|nr:MULTISPECIES: ABC transporter permease [unclassified Pseudobutyrivibrio]SEA19466.1 ABC-2 type transport system permease protein [Pseudobutyrivibrio sp. ACV-2]SET02631.1 ABC-2 type transport system permease protein [Pseudobutyrivibrio sp. C4]
MSVFNAILKSLKANITTIIVYLTIFTVFGNMQAKATTSTQESAFEEVTVKVAVTDNDNSNLSQALVDYLTETQEVVAPGTDDPQVMNDNVRFAIYDYALIIPEGFEEQIKSGDVEDALTYIAPGTTASQFLLTEKLNDYLQDVVVYLNSGYSENEAISLTHDQMVKLSNTQATVVDKSEENHRSYYSGMYTFNGYTLMMLLCVCCACTLTFMKNRDVNNRISVSGMHFFTRNAASIAAVIFIGFAITTVAIIVISLMGLEYENTKFIFYAIDTYTLMFVGLGMAYFICSITVNESLINMVANMFVLSMSFLCGVFVDTQYLSASIVKAAHFLPLYWYTTAIKFINDTPINNIWSRQFASYLLIEVLFAMVFFAAGLIITKKKEQYAI